MGAVDLVDEQLRLLMRQAQTGDAAAYRALLTAVTPRIRRIVRARRGFLDVAEAEDIVQDVLLSMHSVLATYDSSRPFIPWLMAIIRNRLVDAARRHGRQHAHETQVDDIQVTFGDAATNTAEEGMGDVELLQQAIRALPAGQRQAIELIKLQELSLKEASEATGASVTALKVATHRAIVSLRRILGVSSDEH